MLAIAVHAGHMEQMRQDISIAFKKVGAKEGGSFAFDLFKAAMNWVAAEDSDGEIRRKCRAEITCIKQEAIGPVNIESLVDECTNAVINCRTGCQSDEATM